MPTKKVAKPAAKKTTKKAPAKKVSAGKKSATTQKATKKVLVCAHEGECFWTSDGQILNDLRALEAALATMSTAVWKHHVSTGKHDFATWVEDVLQDAECAAALRSAKTPRSARTVVVRSLKTYQL